MWYVILLKKCVLFISKYCRFQQFWWKKYCLKQHFIKKLSFPAISFQLLFSAIVWIVKRQIEKYFLTILLISKLLTTSVTKYNRFLVFVLCMYVYVCIYNIYTSYICMSVKYIYVYYIYVCILYCYFYMFYLCFFSYFLRMLNIF